MTGNRRLVSILSITLFISLAANVFACSHFARLLAERYWSDKAQDYALREKLPPSDRVVLERAVAASQPKMSQLRQALAVAREKELLVTRAEPFDRLALEARVNEEHQHKLQALLLLRETRQKAAGGMSPEGRAILQQMRRLGFSRSEADPLNIIKTPSTGP